MNLPNDIEKVPAISEEHRCRGCIADNDPDFCSSLPECRTYSGFDVQTLKEVYTNYIFIKKQENTMNISNGRIYKAIRYVTEDGKEFANKKEAELHLQKLDLARQLADLDCLVNVSDSNLKELAAWIMTNYVDGGK